MSENTDGTLCTSTWKMNAARSLNSTQLSEFLELTRRFCVCAVKYYCQNNQNCKNRAEMSLVMNSFCHFRDRLYSWGCTDCTVDARCFHECHCQQTWQCHLANTRWVTPVCVSFQLLPSSESQRPQLLSCPCHVLSDNVIHLYHVTFRCHVTNKFLRIITTYCNKKPLQQQGVTARCVIYKFLRSSQPFAIYSEGQGRPMS